MWQPRPATRRAIGTMQSMYFSFGLVDLARLGDRHFDIALVVDFITEFFEFLLQVGIADGAGTHVDAAPVGADVEGNAQNIDVHISPEK